jgi:hypothetical protein
MLHGIDSSTKRNRQPVCMHSRKTCMYISAGNAVSPMRIGSWADGVSRQHYKTAVRDLILVQSFVLRQQPLSRVHNAFRRITVVWHECKDVVCHDALQPTVSLL